MFTWCNGEKEVIELVIERKEDYQVIVKEASKIAGIIEESSDGGKIHMITRTCSCTLENSITKIIDRFDLLQISPIAYEAGWEYYRVIAFRHQDIDELLREFEKRGYSFKMLRKVPFDGFIASLLTLTADALFSDLTRKQIDALMTAYNYGYYRLPRKTDVKTIARNKKVSRTTFQEHLKKAENKLVSSLAPYIQLFKLIPPDRRRNLILK
ncbi:MAG: helix-turn-helix domain-containing protein [Candidatus Atabeyarchaeum deiterrae]